MRAFILHRSRSRRSACSQGFIGPPQSAPPRLFRSPNPDPSICFIAVLGSLLVATLFTNERRVPAKRKENRFGRRILRRFVSAAPAPRAPTLSCLSWHSLVKDSSQLLSRLDNLRPRPCRRPRACKRLVASGRVHHVAGAGLLVGQAFVDQVRAGSFFGSGNSRLTRYSTPQSSRKSASRRQVRSHAPSRRLSSALLGCFSPLHCCTRSGSREEVLGLGLG